MSTLSPPWQKFNGVSGLELSALYDFYWFQIMQIKISHMQKYKTHDLRYLTMHANSAVGGGANSCLSASERSYVFAKVKDRMLLNTLPYTGNVIRRTKCASVELRGKWTGSGVFTRLVLTMSCLRIKTQVMQRYYNVHVFHRGKL